MLKQKWCKKGDQWNHPNEFVLGYFFDGKDRLLIVPDDSDYVLNYTSYNGGDIGYFESFGSDGEISIYM